MGLAMESERLAAPTIHKLHLREDHPGQPRGHKFSARRPHAHHPNFCKAVFSDPPPKRTVGTLRVAPRRAIPGVGEGCGTYFSSTPARRIFCLLPQGCRSPCQSPALLARRGVGRTLRTTGRHVEERRHGPKP